MPVDTVQEDRPEQKRIGYLRNVKTLERKNSKCEGRTMLRLLRLMCTHHVLLDRDVLGPELHRLLVLGKVQRDTTPSKLFAQRVAHHGDGLHGKLVVCGLPFHADYPPRCIGLGSLTQCIKK